MRSTCATAATRSWSGVRKGASWTKAKKDGLQVAEPLAAVKGAQLDVAMLVPDLTQKALYADIKSGIEVGSTLLFAHGFNIHFKQIKPRKDLDVVLIAPKGPGDSGAASISARPRCALPAGDRAKSIATCEGQGFGVCRRYRRHARRRP